MSPSSSPSPTHLDVRDQFTTTTVFADPTFLGSESPAAEPVPVAAIAAGSAAGVILAVLAVVGWRWWGRRIRSRQMREFEKRKAIQAAVAYRRSVLGGKKPLSSADSRRSRSPPSKSPADRKVQFTGISPPSTSSTITSSTTLSSNPISSPRRLRATAIDGAPAPLVKTPRSFRAGLLDGKSYKPLKPSPLGGPASHASINKHLPGPAFDMAPTPTGVEKHQHLEDEARESDSGSRRIPRIKASLASLTGEARRQSKTSQTSASDQSRHSSAGGSSRRWSWWSLINGPGFSLRQIGVGTGKNRLSVDTSEFPNWPEDDPSVPIGYAYSAPADDTRVTVGDSATDGGDYTVLSNYQYHRNPEKLSAGDTNS